MTSAESTTPTAPTPRATPKRSPTGPPTGKDADNAALSDALAIEHSTIDGYGIVSALSPPSVNGLVVDALLQHRQRRDDVIAMLAARKVTPRSPPRATSCPCWWAALPMRRAWPCAWRTTARRPGARSSSTPRRQMTARSPRPH